MTELANRLHTATATIRFIEISFQIILKKGDITFVLRKRRRGGLFPSALRAFSFLLPVRPKRVLEDSRQWGGLGWGWLGRELPTSRVSEVQERGGLGSGALAAPVVGSHGELFDAIAPDGV